jgi:site-specific DNA recombinase
MPSTNGHGPKRAILYTRVSTDEQARSGYSIPDQLKQLREHAVLEGYQVVEEIEDEGYSGGDPYRPGLQRVMQLAETDEIDVVIAAKCDRFFRSRLHRLLWDKDLADFGVKLISLNDTGNRLADGFQDDFAEWEREMIRERTIRGKLEKAREGKIVASCRPKYGFAFTPEKEALLVNEGQITVVRRIFEMVGPEGKTINATRLALSRQGVPTARGARSWSAQAIRDYILDDAYKAHDHQEVADLVSPDVLGSLDPERRYGVWWFNRRQWTKNRRTGKHTYKWRRRSEWVAVPIPDSGVPREWVDLARKNIHGNRKKSALGKRFWELSGGIARCDICGRTLTTQMTYNRRGRQYFYYTCRTFYEKGRDICPGRINFRAAELENRVWSKVSEVLKSPDRLRRGLERMIERERGEQDPTEETVRLTRLLNEIEAKRARFQHLYAEGVIEMEDLRARLSELDATYSEAQQHRDVLETRRKHLKELERDKDELLASYEILTRESLEELSPEDRNGLYRRLNLAVGVARDGEPKLSADVDLTFSKSAESSSRSSGTFPA